jgi:hypothetical protein
MFRNSILILTLSFCLVLNSCVELSRNTKIDETYFVDNDPNGSFKTLYYSLDDGNSIVRVQKVKRVGHTNKFIIAEIEDGFYFIDKQKDNQYLNGEDIIGNIRTHEYFISWLDSMKISNFEFDYYEDK